MKTFLQILILFVSVSIFGQTSNKFGYQAVVRDALNGLLQNHNLKVRASILIGNNAVYSEVHLPKTNDNGLFNLQVGGGVAESGNFSNIDWSQGNLFLKIETDIMNGLGYSIVSSTELLSVPFANFSNIAGNLSGVAGKMVGVYKAIFSSPTYNFNMYYMNVTYQDVDKVKIDIYGSQDNQSGALCSSYIGTITSLETGIWKVSFIQVVFYCSTGWILNPGGQITFSDNNKITVKWSNGTPVVFDKIP